QLAGEILVQEIRVRAARSVQDQHRLARGRTDRRVVQPYLGKHLPGVKAEVLRDPVGFFRRRVVRGARRETPGKGKRARRIDASHRLLLGYRYGLSIQSAV